METKTKAKVTQQDFDGEPFISQLTNGSSAQTKSESAEEVIHEFRGTDNTGDESVSLGGTETDESSPNRIPTPEDHKSLSSPFQASVKNAEVSDEAATVDEAADTESAFENVEGFEESQPLEFDPESEPVVEASLADMESTEDGKEFFGAIISALAPMVLPMAKSLLPSLAGAAVKQVPKLVKGIIKKGPKISPVLLQQLKNAKVSPQILKMLETGEAFDENESGDESAETDESATAAFQQQIEALEVIIGKDDRVQVTNTTIIPWKRICHLKIQAANGKSYLGTGFFVGPRTILTAGHCVYIHGQGGWAKQIVVTPGRNGSSESMGKFTSRTFRSVSGWVNHKLRDCDYGVIQLAKTDAIPSGMGAFGFANYSDAYLKSKRLNTAGYPGDKPSGTMWFNGRKAKSVTTRTIVYDIDTMGGQSGSPVWIKAANGERIAVGIHTNGATSGNSATRIIKPVFDNIKKWRTEGWNQLEIKVFIGSRGLNVSWLLMNCSVSAGLSTAYY